MDGWFYETDGERRGPLTVEQIKELVKVGAIRGYTMVTPPGADEPVSAGTCRELVALPHYSGSVIFPAGYSRPAMLSLLLGVLSFIPPFAFAGLVVTGFAIRDLSRNRDLKGDGRAVIGGLLSLIFSVIYALAFFR
jgi:GYF domain 2